MPQHQPSPQPAVHVVASHPTTSTSKISTSTKRTLTLPLLEKLQESRQKIKLHVERKMKLVDDEVQSFHQLLHEEQTELNQIHQELQSIQTNRNSSSSSSDANTTDPSGGLRERRSALEQEQMEWNEKLKKLEQEQVQQTLTLEALKEEERLHRKKAEDIRDRKVCLEESNQTILNDLTRVIHNYKKLGFDFVKGKHNNGLRFSFTHLDAGDHERTLGFTLTASEEDDVYLINDCPLDAATIGPLLQRLNETDDMANFMLEMRRAFSASVV